MTFLAATVFALCTVTAVPETDQARNMTIVTRAFGPCVAQAPPEPGLAKPEAAPPVFIKWGNFMREVKLARLAGAAPKPAPAPQAKKKPAAMKKARCRKGERQWYWNAKKNRRMYRVRRTC